MTDVLVLAHVAHPYLRVLQGRAAWAGVRLRVVRTVDGDRLPPIAYDARSEPFQAVVVLGGPQSAHRRDDAPYLADEIAFLESAHAAEVPILAICLGAQLLAEALGGAALPGPNGLEFGPIQVDSVDETVVASGVYLSFHSDTMRAPDGARDIARSADYLQGWRLGTSTAVQFHPELDTSGFRDLLTHEGPKLTRHGVDVEALRAEVDALPDPSEHALAVLDTWFADIARRPVPAASRNTRDSARVGAEHGQIR